MIALYVFVIAIAGAASHAVPVLDIVPRSKWKARPAAGVTALRRPVPFVVVHHSYSPPACTAPSECEASMRWMQDYHQINRSWWDIGYNFAVGGDGRAYEGRGWDAVGAHAPLYNNISIGVCVIGDWSDTAPPERQLETVQNLIAEGVRAGYIAGDYKLVGHKQVRKGTQCPGDALYALIEAWPHYDSAPSLRVSSTTPTPPVENTETNRIRKRKA
ncbi:hypothetical protein NQ315_000260 [Exocentrus adspersus]|uniref:Peptidoglycan-recognition protein n=1 Tax=Exocentrus adspersus TaxID=1586481 RepID=A0AAV8VRC2_9CUCU|nr:hypothetical protein NQ315_000260 [Exocentrus adspersus]